jgi:hypothetical protein
MNKKWYLFIAIIILLVLGIVISNNTYSTKLIENKELTPLNLSFFEQPLNELFANCTHYRDNELSGSSNLYYYCSDNNYRFQFMPHSPGYKSGCCLKMGNQDFEKFDIYKGYSFCIKGRNMIAEVNDYNYSFYIILTKNVSEETLKDVVASASSKLNVTDAGFNIFQNCIPADSSRP